MGGRHAHAAEFRLSPGDYRRRFSVTGNRSGSVVRDEVDA